MLKVLQPLDAFVVPEREKILNCTLPSAVFTVHNISCDANDLFCGGLQDITQLITAAPAPLVRWMAQCVRPYHTDASDRLLLCSNLCFLLNERPPAQIYNARHQNAGKPREIVSVSDSRSARLLCCSVAEWLDWHLVSVTSPVEFCK